MIKRILIAIIVLAAFMFGLIWILSGGTQNIRAAIDHYRNPFKYDNIFDYIFNVGTTTGETFKLPGTPSSFPTLTLPTDATTSPSDSTTTTVGADGYVQ